MDKLFGIVIVFFVSVLGVFGAIEVFLQIYDSFIDRGYSVDASFFILFIGICGVAVVNVFIFSHKSFWGINKKL